MTFINDLPLSRSPFTKNRATDKRSARNHDSFMCCHDVLGFV